MRLGLKFIVYGRQDVEHRHVIIGILPCVVITTSLETGASMATMACIDMLMVRRNPARSRRKRVLKELFRFWRKKRSEVVYLEIRVQRSLVCGKLGKRDWMLRRDALLNSQDAPGTKFKLGKEKGPSRGVIHGERNPCAPTFEERTLEETSRQEECARKAAWDLARKTCKLRAQDKATFILL